MQNLVVPRFAFRAALALLSSVSFFALTGTALADPATKTPLDWLPSGQSQAQLLGLSGDGSVAVGYARTLSNKIHAVSWLGADGSITDLGFAVGNSYAYAISFDGTAIVGVHYGATDLAYVIQNNVLSYLAPGVAGQGAIAYAVNADGTFIAGQTTFPGSGGNSHAALWSGAGWSTVTDLGVLAGGAYSMAYGVSGDGSVVVGWSDIGAHGHAFYWDGTLHDLGVLDINGSSAAYAISKDGTTIVGSSYLGTGQTVVAWTGANYGIATDLGTLGGNSGQANAVNATGSVIVGTATLSNNNTHHAFRYENGVMADLNTLLTDAGVDMTGITLDTATAISGHGDYIGANDGDGGKGYIVFYEADGSAPPIGGLTTGEDQQNAADELAEAHQAAAVQAQGFGEMLLGGNDSLNAPAEVGAFGAVGSLTTGISGKVALGQGLSLLGGLSYAEEDFDNIDMNHAVMAALALRYVFDETSVAHPFAESGGWIAPEASFTFRRPYANGGGTATGVGSADGTLGYAYVKGGLGYDVTPDDEAVLAVELGYSAFKSDGYVEPLTATNPFNAQVSSGTDSLGIVKLEAKWTHDFTPSIDATLRVAGAKGFAASSGVTTTVAGFGTITAADPDNASWAEYGARVGYQITDATKVSVFADGISGEKSIHSETHIGIDLRFEM